MTKYILVTFPEIQDFMEHPRFGECIFCESIEGHPVESSTYAVRTNRENIFILQLCRLSY